MDNFFGHSLFNDIENAKLQAYNRLQMVNNLRKSKGLVFTRDYISKISQPHRTNMMVMAADVKMRGMKPVTIEMMELSNA